MKPDPDWRELPFQTVWIGHLVTGAIIGIVILIGSAVANWIVLGSLRLSSLVVVIVCAMLVLETISTVIDRARSRKAHHDQPGGWFAPIVRILVSIAVYGVVSFIVIRTFPGVIIPIIAALVAEIIVMAIMKPWEEGMTVAEVREKNQAVIEMTKRMIAEEREKKQQKS